MEKLKKAGIVSAAALLFFVAASMTAYLTGFIPCPKQSYGWAFLCAGIFILILSGIAAFIIRDKTPVNAACFFVNAAALGLCMRAWYIFRELDNGFLTLFLVCLACIAYLWLFFALCLIPPVSRHIKLFFWIWLILSLAAYLMAVIFTKTTFVSTFGYYMLVLCSFIYAIVSHSSDIKDLIRALALSTYSVFAVAVIAAVIVVTEDGDFALDFVGELIPDARSGKKKAARKPKKI